MVEFIDKTNDQQGTPLDRAHLMAVQDFSSKTINFMADGSIVETNWEGHTKTTTFNQDGTITERFEGEKTITKNISFSGNQITENISI